LIRGNPFMILEPLDYLNGTLSIIIVTTNIIVGVNIASKYFHYKQREFLLIGIFWMGIACPWYPSSISFLVALATGEGLGIHMYLIFGDVLIPALIVIWLAGITDLMYKDKQKLVLILASIYGVLFEIIFFYLLFTDYTLLGELQGIVDVQYKIFLIIYILSVFIILLITVLLLSLDLLKSEDPELKLKGKLILIGSLSFLIGALIDASVPLNFITLPITRLVLILSSIEFYAGFVLPEWTKKLFLKQEAILQNEKKKRKGDLK
jgi:hypothetical protein